MQIEIDIEKLISRNIIDVITNQNNIQKEVDNILKGDECQKILTKHIKIRLNEILSSEDGKKQVDKSIIDGIAKSSQIQNKIGETLEGYECGDILEQQTKACLHEVIFSEEGKGQISNKIKEYLENYEIEYEDNVVNELNKWISDILLITMKDSLEKFKVSNRQ